jgi:Pyruvate/2-oxoacid:ferredoxin oxidoreductase gamma subunit
MGNSQTSRLVSPKIGRGANNYVRWMNTVALGALIWVTFMVAISSKLQSVIEGFRRELAEVREGLGATRIELDATRVA